MHFRCFVLPSFVQVYVLFACSPLNMFLCTWLMSAWDSGILCFLIVKLIQQYIDLWQLAEGYSSFLPKSTLSNSGVNDPWFWWVCLSGNTDLCRLWRFTFDAFDTFSGFLALSYSFMLLVTLGNPFLHRKAEKCLKEHFGFAQTLYFDTPLK